MIDETHRDADARDEDDDAPSSGSVLDTIREDDIEPYTGLAWVGTVSKAAAIFLLVALLGQFVAGLRENGVADLPFLLGETAQTFVLMIVLWGGGDLVKLLVDVGHDIRAQRIMLTRLEWRTRGLVEEADMTEDSAD
jgi:hypothetical protein